MRVKELENRISNKLPGLLGVHVEGDYADLGNKEMPTRMFLTIDEAVGRIQGAGSDYSLGDAELTKPMMKYIISRLKLQKKVIPYRIYAGKEFSFDLKVKEDRKHLRGTKPKYKWNKIRAVSEYTLGAVEVADLFIEVAEEVYEEIIFSNEAEMGGSAGYTKPNSIENHISVDNFPSAQKYLEISRSKKEDLHSEQISKDLVYLFNKINEASHKGETLIVLDNYFDDSNYGDDRTVERIASSATVKRILVDKGYRVSFETQKKYLPSRIIPRDYIEGRISWDKHPDFFEDDWDPDEFEACLNE